MLAARLHPTSPRSKPSRETAGLPCLPGANLLDERLHRGRRVGTTSMKHPMELALRINANPTTAGVAGHIARLRPAVDRRRPERGEFLPQGS
jgi:hypothetical protein